MAPEDRVAFLWQISICQIANTTYSSRSTSSFSCSFRSLHHSLPISTRVHLGLIPPLHTCICKFWNCCCLLTAFCIWYIPIKCLHTMPEFQIRFRSEQVPHWMTDSQTNEHMPFRMHKRIKCRADWYTLRITDTCTYVCKAATNKDYGNSEILNSF